MPPYQPLTRLHRRKTRLLLSASTALLFYGAWGWYANSNHGSTASASAAIVQAGYSFTVTLCLGLFIEWLFQQGSTAKSKVLLPVCASSALLYTTSTGTHLLMGTPEILKTILPGLIISTFYAFFYSLSLLKLYPANNEVSQPQEQVRA